jgi:hypothetical protein
VPLELGGEPGAVSDLEEKGFLGGAARLLHHARPRRRLRRLVGRAGELHERLADWLMGRRQRRFAGYHLEQAFASAPSRRVTAARASLA